MINDESKEIEEEILYNEEDSGTSVEPFDPKDVDIISQTMVISNIIERLRYEEIVLDPDKLRLKGLEYLQEYNGLFYENLPPRIRRRLNEQSIIAYLIRSGTPEKVRTSIFTRINTGGLTLKPAEI